MKKFLTIVTLALATIPAASYAQDNTPTPPPGPAGAMGHEGSGKMLKDADTNGDGMISKDEFTAFHEKRFTEMDTNSDGQISQDEIKAKAQEWREKMNERRKEFMEKRQGMMKGKTPAEPTQAQ
ncbi:MAG: EF-hand domain-containing protein [Alphaproteobacteria bacterium]|nr:EF-hand domain-containing protein [Alphaproteobacteria bacterium]